MVRYNGVLIFSWLACKSRKLCLAIAHDRITIHHPREVDLITHSQGGAGVIIVAWFAVLAKMARSLCPALALLFLLAGISTTRKRDRACNYTLVEAVCIIICPAAGHAYTFMRRQ